MRGEKVRGGLLYDKEAIRSFGLVKGHQDQAVEWGKDGAMPVIGQVFSFADFLKIEVSGSHVEMISGLDVVHVAQDHHRRQMRGALAQ